MPGNARYSSFRLQFRQVHRPTWSVRCCPGYISRPGKTERAVQLTECATPGKAKANDIPSYTAQSFSKPVFRTPVSSRSPAPFSAEVGFLKRSPSHKKKKSKRPSYSHPRKPESTSFRRPLVHSLCLPEHAITNAPLNYSSAHTPLAQTPRPPASPLRTSARTCRSCDRAASQAPGKPGRGRRAAAAAVRRTLLLPVLAAAAAVAAAAARMAV